MKKIIILILSLTFILSLGMFVACENKEQENSSLNQDEEIVEEDDEGFCKHEYQVEKTIPATCTTPLEKVFKCKKCGKTYTETEGSPLGHDGEWVLKKAPTCSTEGIEERTCIRCGKVDERKIPPVPHNYVEIEEERVEPDCTKNGKKVFKCSNPGCNERYEQIIFAKGHTKQGKGTVTPPTCVKDGFTEYTCSVCGEKFISDIVKATGHKFVEQGKVEATCEHGQGTKYVCSECGETKIEYTGQRLPHQFDENGNCTLCHNNIMNMMTVSLSDKMYDVSGAGSMANGWIFNYKEGEMNSAPKFDLIIKKDFVNAYLAQGVTGATIIFDRKTNDHATNISVGKQSVNGACYVEIPFVKDEDAVIKDVTISNIPDWVASGEGWLPADGFKVKMALKFKYDFKNPSSYIEAGLPYIYNKTAKCYEADYLSSYGYQDGTTIIVIKKEYLESLKANGATQLMIRATGSGRVGIAKADLNATDISNRGGSVSLTKPFDLNNLPVDKDLVDEDGNITIKVYSSESSHFRIYLSSDDPNNPDNLIKAGLPYTFNEEEGCYEANYLASYGYEDNTSTFTITKAFIEKLKEEGVKKIMIRATGSGRVGIAKADPNATDISTRGESVKLNEPIDLYNLPEDEYLVDEDGNITLKVYSSLDSHFRVYIDKIME